MDTSQAFLQSSNNEEIYPAFRRHQSGRRISTELAVLEFLRDAYPDCHTTLVDRIMWDYKGFAAAGFAKCDIDKENDVYNAARAYRKAPGPRLGQEAGSLVDTVKYARWNYVWKGNEYMIYEIEYETMAGRNQPLLFILNPRTDEEVNYEDISLIDQLMIAVGEWSSALHNDIYVFDNERWHKSPQLWKAIQDSTWDDVILSPDMKSNLIEDVTGFFDNKDLYKKLAVPWKRGLIFHGVPGNGKTITIKALIASLSRRPEPIPSLYVKSFDSKRDGTAAIRTIFTHARSMAPCLLIFEDLDSLITDQTRSYFLNEVDGLESNDGILMVGSTNHLDTLDPAITKRPSRFDRKYHFRLPEEDERAAYARYWQHKLLGNDMVEFPDELCSVIAKMSAGFSFAYLKELFVMALLAIARGGTGDEDAEKPVMVQRGDAVADVGKDAREEGVPSEVPEKKRHVIPRVETPQSLEDNMLLKVLRSSLEILADEMDNTDEKEWPSTKKQAGGIGVGQVTQAAFRMRKALAI